MTRQRKTAIWILAIAILAAGVVTLQVFRSRVRRLDIAQVALVGAVLRNDSDPQKQSPVGNAKITATGGLSSANGYSDASGLFRLTLRPGVLPRQPVTLRFEHPAYQPLEMTVLPQGKLYIVRMEPSAPQAAKAAVRAPGPVKPGASKAPGNKTVKIENIRYSSKNQTTMNVGSVAKQFSVWNKGDTPCDGHAPCSPNGRWKGSVGVLSLDAEEGNEFRNVRVSCVAGPCPFTKIDPEDLSNPGRLLKVSVLNWSDEATFLLEAEVTRTVVANQVRTSYPFKVGDSMTFALPLDAEGVTIAAEVNGDAIIFPLGPNLFLSWATCSVEVAATHTKIYRCELKPGYQFPQ